MRRKIVSALAIGPKTFVQPSNLGIALRYLGVALRDRFKIDGVQPLDLFAQMLDVLAVDRVDAIELPLVRARFHGPILMVTDRPTPCGAAVGCSPTTSASSIKVRHTLRPARVGRRSQRASAVDFAMLARDGVFQFSDEAPMS